MSGAQLGAPARGSAIVRRRRTRPERSPMRRSRWRRSPWSRAPTARRAARPRRAPVTATATVATRPRTAQPRSIPSASMRRALAQRAGRRHGRDAERQGLLARRVRRRHLHLGRRELLRLDRRHAPQPTDRRHGRDAAPATATGSSPPTAASSASATRTSTARPAPCTSTSRSSASSPPARGHGYWLVARDGGVFSLRRRALLRLDRRHPPQPADRRRRRDADRPRLLVRRARRRHLLLRRRALQRLDRRRAPLAADRRHGPAPSGNGYLLLAANGRVLQLRQRDATTAPPTNACPGAPAVAIATAPQRARLLDRLRQRAGVRALARSKRPPKCAPPQPATKIGAGGGRPLQPHERRARGPRARRRSRGTRRSRRTPRAGARRWAASDLHHSNIGSLLGPYDYVGENIATGSAACPPARCTSRGCTRRTTATTSCRPASRASASACTARPTARSGRPTEFGRPRSAGPPPPYGGDTPVNPVARPDADSIGC